MSKQRVGTREQWQAERDELLAAEKEHTRRGDELAERRRQLTPIARQNAEATGTDVLRYIAEGWGFGTFVADGDSLYHAYSTTGAGSSF
jgi:hypothetical protein